MILRTSPSSSRPPVTATAHHRRTRAPGKWGSRVELQLNDGQGHFRAQPVERIPAAAVIPAGMNRLVDLDGDGRAELLGVTLQESPEAEVHILAHYEHGTWQEKSCIPFQRLPEEAQYYYKYVRTPLSYVGDVDADGNWDVGVPLAAYYEDTRWRFLGLQRPRPSQEEASDIWLPWTVHLFRYYAPPIVPQVWDLNGDGLFDPLFVDANYRRGTALLVWRGQRGERPIAEGRYPLPAGARGWAVGDVDGDEDLDVVVVVENAEKAGIYVRRNGTRDRPMRLHRVVERMLEAGAGGPGIAPGIGDISAETIP